MSKATKNTCNSLNAIAGFSTIEILIAFSVGIVFLSAAMMVAFSDTSLTKQVSVDSGQATALDTMLDNGGVYRSTTCIGDLTKSLAMDWNKYPTCDTIDGVYTYKPPAVSDISQCMKQVLSETDWSSINKPKRYVEMNTIVSNMAVAQALGPGGCDPTPPGGGGIWWDNPADAGWNVTPSQLSGSGSGIGILNIAGRTYAFVTTWTRSNGGGNGNVTKPDLWPIDISTPESPTSLPGLNTSAGGTSPGLGGIAVATINNTPYAFVIQNDSSNQFQVIDLSSPTGLTTSAIKANIPLPNMTSSVIPTSIAYYNGYVYIGTPYVAFGAGNQNQEFHVYCVSDASVRNCSPTTPVWMGSFNVNHNVNDVAIEQRIVNGTNKTYAFLATSDSSGSYPELTILDVTNPAAISLAGSLTLPGTMYGTSIYVLGNRVYLGRQRATGSYFDFYVLDISTSLSSPSILKKLQLGLGPNTAVTKILVHGNIAFLLTSDSNAPIEIWDAGSNASSVVKVSSCANIINLPVSIDLAYYNDLIYIVNQNQAAMNTIHDQPTTCTP